MAKAGLMNKAIQQNKALLAIQLAAAGTSLVQNTIAMGVGTGVQFVAGAIAHVEAKWRYVIGRPSCDVPEITTVV